MRNHIYVVSSSGQGHILPCFELCKLLTSRGYQITVVIPSAPFSFLPNLTDQHHGLPIKILQIAPPPAHDLQAQFTERRALEHPFCAIIDFQMGWATPIFLNLRIPAACFFTFGACTAAMEWATYKAEVGNMKPDEARLLPGLPKCMQLSYLDIQRRPVGPGGRGPPKPGDQPPWVKVVEMSSALIFNSCDALERHFMSYMHDQMAKPAWGMGPLLPQQYYCKATDSLPLVSDRKIRSQTYECSYPEEEVIQWLDSKPRSSVLYVSFGSEVSPTVEEYVQMAMALENSTQPFIWVIQTGSGRPTSTSHGSNIGEDYQYHPHGLDSKVGERGLIIRGWAPQLLILSHPSTGGFLSHCGWNSTLEAVVRGVPIVAWPIRGDQHYNAKLVVDHLKVGHRATSRDASQMVQKDDIVRGIESLMNDEETRKRAAEIQAKFEHGFPASFEASLNDFEAYFNSLAS